MIALFSVHYYMLFPVEADLVPHVEGDIRLVGGRHPEEGTLEVFHQGTWMRVKHNHFSDLTADVRTVVF